MDIMSLDWLAQEIGGQLPLIKGMGGSLVEPIGFVLMNVKVPCVRGYDEDQVTLVMDDPEMSKCPVILGTSTLYWVMEVIKESEISKLAVPWSSSQISWLMQDVTAKLGQVVVNNVANKPITPLDVDEVVQVASKCTVPPFGHKVIHGKVNLVLHGCRLNCKVLLLAFRWSVFCFFYFFCNCARGLYLSGYALMSCDFGECCESVPWDRSGSYVSISIKYITIILARFVQVDAFYCRYLSHYI